MFRGKGCEKLPRTLRILKGWQKLVSSLTQQPLPLQICAGIPMWLLEASGVEFALAWLLMVDCLLRPSECLRLQVSQFLQPNRDMHMKTGTIQILSKR